MTALKSLLYLLVVQNFGFYVPLALCRSGPKAPTGTLAYFAFLMWSLGILGVLWCFWDFTYRGRGTPLPTDPPKELVAAGLYRHVRNPIYLSVILILLGHFLWFGYSSLLVYAGLAFVGTHLFVIFYEEPGLRKRFGAAYEDYLMRVPRWLPTFK
jgi:protein-S-isoprenylcysteine O-methyltransferase Ste14